MRAALSAGSTPPATSGAVGRALFVLREVLGLGHGEVEDLAGAVGESPAAVRRIGHRARTHVAARRPRQAVSPALPAVRVEDALITGLHAVRDPERPSRVDQETAVSRWVRRHVSRWACARGEVTSPRTGK